MSYATTPTLSVDAPHDSVRLVCPMFEQLGWPGWVGCWVSPDAPTVSLSTFGPPLAVVAVARILLVPALNSFTGKQLSFNPIAQPLLALSVIAGGVLLGVIATTGYGGIVLLMAIESACIPLPSEVIMPFSGYLVSTGRFGLNLVAIAGG